MYIHPTGIVVGLLVAATAASGSSPHNNSAVYKSLYSVHSNSTPVFQHVPGHSVNRFVRGSHGASEKGSFLLTKRDDELPVGTCAPGIPCVNGACCSDKGICGFSPDECGKDTCISNCDAKAECGQYAPSETFTCPLNVCCSEYGFCGTTEDFCEAGCQEGYGGCGSVTEPSCGSQTMMRTVGYYEGWASTRSCDKRLPSDIDVAPLTHINFAFAFFHPTTFEMTPMNAGDEALYPQFTALKSKKPSLRTWIAVGGWSFNDATNSPNTQTAFSDMAGSAENRRTFINSLLNFMQTWGFDGVDLDWEYPGADDRGGITADTANFVHLLRDMKNAFGGSYGISVTLPASYWYLRWFDVQGMQEHVDFFNIMTYDIHGVWDASNKHTGPYVRPHTNITEIKQGLDLLWRNEIDPSGVNFGLGWYGRSFTLEDPSCNRPDCIFSYGGKPGECTQSSGTLSNSEIQRIIAKHDLTPTLDADAAVKWITWDADQWVSYDDGETIQMKMAEANKLCLGGVLIWAVDLDGSDHASSNDLLGVGVANGVSPTDAETFRTTKESLERAASIGNSCYWSFCGDSCVEGFTSQTYSKGQVPNILGDVSCTDNSVRTLCCAPGTTTGTCSWQGWNGVGMTCSTGYCPEDSEVIAMNTNSYQEDADLQINNNHTCNGGAQTYCCSGFVPSQIANTDSLSLLGDYLAATDAQKDLVERFVLPPGSRPTTACTVALGVAGVAQYLFKVPIIGPILAESAIFLGCAVPRLWKSFHPGTVRPDSSPSGSKSQSEVDKIAHLQGQGPAGIGQKPHGERKDAPKKHKLRIGQYEYAEYDDEDLDCETTYTCDYGRGFDEICDNMRWGIERGLGDKRVYNKAINRPAETYKDNWKRQRLPYYLKNAARPDGWPKHPKLPRCNLEEFPFGSLEEGQGDKGYQVVRLVNAKVNAAHGNDWSNWLKAVWEPCKELREAKGLPKPPITMTWSPFEDGDHRDEADALWPHFIEAYGFNSQGDVECFPTFSTRGGDGQLTTTTLTDYGFRALTDDPMFVEYQYPMNDYWHLPREGSPFEIIDVNWLKVKREIALGVLQQDLPPSAIREAEYAAEHAAELPMFASKPADPTPTDAAAFGGVVATDTPDNSWQPSRGPMPIETGVVDVPEEPEEPVDGGHMMRRRKQHLLEHQNGPRYGHGNW